MAAADLMDVLRELATQGTTIVMTTHHLEDLRVADRLVAVVSGGRLAFDGPPALAPEYFEVDDMVAVYRVLAATAPDTVIEHEDAPTFTAPAKPTARRVNSSVTQWRILARRDVDVLLRNRMSLAIMAGSPVLVVSMFAILFRSGAFDGATVDPTASVSITYWIAFAGFFFGLTFGLLQICTELAIVRREVLATIDVGPYLLAKAAVLVPVLGAVNLVMIATLAGLDRLPSLSASSLVTLFGVLMLDSLAGLALGLLASAAVSSPAQAALALPMLCFPAVLFSGAVLPRPAMTAVGRAMGIGVSDRWGFEAVARAIHLDRTLAAGDTGRRIAVEHGGALSGSVVSHSCVLVALTLGLLLATHVVLARRTEA